MATAALAPGGVMRAYKLCGSCAGQRARRAPPPAARSDSQNGVENPLGCTHEVSTTVAPL
jgi:hypothetical protein